MSRNQHSTEVQFIRNVIFGGGLHLVVVIAGFVVPRQISDSLGQSALGIWDLGWVTLQYVAMGSLGIEGALSRWVSVINASKEYEKMPAYMTTAFIWQVLVSIIAAVLFGLFVWSMPSFIDLDSPTAYQQAQTVLALMGIALVFKLMGGVYGAIITGCHRFDIQHSIEGGTDSLLAITLVVTLLFSGSLEMLAALVVAVEALACFMRLKYARQLCPEAALTKGGWQPAIAKDMLLFGVKNMIVNAPQLIVVQTVAIALASMAGPAMLSVLNRGLALVRFSNKFVLKMSMQFMSLAGRDVGKGNTQQDHLLIDAGKFGSAAAFPMSIFLLFFGAYLLELWMGKDYANGTMMAVLVLGSLIPATQAAVQYAVTGLNKHGQLATITLVMTVLSLGLAMIVVSIVGWNTENAAWAIAIGWSVGRGAATYHFLFNKLNVPMIDYLRQTLLIPLLCNIPMIVACALAIGMIENERYAATLSTLFAGGIATLIAYWVLMLPKELRVKITGVVRKIKA